MQTENKIKEELNLVYIIDAYAINSFSTEIIRIDYSSVDVVIGFNGYMSEDSTLRQPKINLQLKATSIVKIKNDEIHFNLPIKNYNDLKSHSGNPNLLVVYCMLVSKDEWLNHSKEQLTLKKCAYYLNLLGLPDVENDNSVTVRVTLSNIFSPESLYNLMLKTSKEQKL